MRYGPAPFMCLMLTFTVNKECDERAVSNVENVRICTVSTSRKSIMGLLQLRMYYGTTFCAACVCSVLSCPMRR